MKKICLLGATGSIGTSTLDVIENNPDKFVLESMSFGRNFERAIEIIEKFNPKSVACISKEDAYKISEAYPDIQVFSGQEGLYDLARGEYDLLLNAVMGSVGLKPTMTAIKSGRDVAIANKETLVVAGDFIMPAVEKAGVKLLPVDSEHSAIFQLLHGRSKEDIAGLTITASGGSFRDRSRDELEGVSVEEALNHPNWSMGAKITIDSASMVNKGLEVIEAHHLFGMDYDDIDVIQHEESVIHSLIRLKDGSMMAEMGASDMRQPIQYALTHPSHERLVNEKNFDLASLGQVHFKKMDYQRFPMLALAYKVGRLGGSYPAVYNAANEEAVASFLAGKIDFLDIEKIIERAVDEHTEIDNLSLEKLIDLDMDIRVKVKKWLEA
jgi:1-deoxy-D-xylulose 5-phosphate reductoisomerase